MQPSAWDSPTHTHTFMLRVASSAEFSGIPFGVAIACSCFESKCPGESMEGSVCSQFDTAQIESPCVPTDSVPVLNLEASETQSRNMI